MIMRRELKMHASYHSRFRDGEEVLFPMNINPKLSEHSVVKYFCKLPAIIDESGCLNYQYAREQLVLNGHRYLLTSAFNHFKVSTRRKVCC